MNLDSTDDICNGKWLQFWGAWDMTSNKTATRPPVAVKAYAAPTLVKGPTLANVTAVKSSVIN
jgi:hypothetical protein